jgi:hypothetical protein
MGNGQQRYARVLTGAHPVTQGWPPALGLWLRPVLGAVSRAAELWRALTLSPGLRCTPTSFDDPAIDDLWARRSAHLLLGERSAALLHWRYGRAGRGDWKLCLARTPDGQPVGFLVWRLNDGMADIGDFYSVDPARQTAALLNAFCRFARTQGAHSVSLQFFGARAVVDQIARAGLRARAEPCLVVVDTGAAGVPELADAERWYLTAFDDDAS